MEYTSSVDIGERKRRSGGINEDSVASTVLENHHREDGRSIGVFVLGDGVGGEASGDVASFLVTSVVRKRLTDHLQGSATDVPEQFDIDSYGADPPTMDANPQTVLAEGRIRNAIQDGINAAHQEIQEYASTIGGQPATTVVAAVYADGTLHYGWVGDSRLYLVNTKHGTIRQLTEDHAVTNVRLQRGEIEDEAYARVHRDAAAITNAVGGSSTGKPTVDVEFGSTDVFHDDVIMLTSDGLIDAYTDVKALREEYQRADDTDAVCEKIRETLVTDDEIRDVILAADDLEEAAKRLVEFANDRGGKDNISVTLARDPTARPTPDSMISRAETVIEPAGSPAGADAEVDAETDTGASEAKTDASENAVEAGGTESTDPQGTSRDEKSGPSHSTAAIAEGSAPADATDASDVDPESAEQHADVDAVAVGDGPAPSVGLAIPGQNRVYELTGDVSVGRDVDAEESPDVPLDVATDAHVDPVHALVEFDETAAEWRLTDRSTSGTHVEVNEGGWLLLLSEEGIERHRESGFDPGSATDRSIEQTTTLEDGAAFVVEDPRDDDAITCRFFTSVERARDRLAEGTVECNQFDEFLL